MGTRSHSVVQPACTASMRGGMAACGQHGPRAARAPQSYLLDCSWVDASASTDPTLNLCRYLARSMSWPAPALARCSLLTPAEQQRLATTRANFSQRMTELYTFLHSTRLQDVNKAPHLRQVGSRSHASCQQECHLAMMTRTSLRHAGGRSCVGREQQLSSAHLHEGGQAAHAGNQHFLIDIVATPSCQTPLDMKRAPRSGRKNCLISHQRQGSSQDAGASVRY